MTQPFLEKPEGKVPEEGIEVPYLQLASETLVAVIEAFILRNGTDYGTEEAKLETKVAKGGAGVWGTMPMPAMNNVKPEDIKTMVTHILAMAK